MTPTLPSRKELQPHLEEAEKVLMAAPETKLTSSDRKQLEIIIEEHSKSQDAFKKTDHISMAYHQMMLRKDDPQKRKVASAVMARLCMCFGPVDSEELLPGIEAPDPTIQENLQGLAAEVARLSKDNDLLTSLLNDKAVKITELETDTVEQTEELRHKAELLETDITVAEQELKDAEKQNVELRLTAVQEAELRNRLKIELEECEAERDLLKEENVRLNRLQNSLVVSSGTVDLVAPVVVPVVQTVNPVKDIQAVFLAENKERFSLIVALVGLVREKIPGQQNVALRVFLDRIEAELLDLLG